MVSLNSLQSVTNGNKLLMNSLVIKLLACISQLTSRLNITLAKFQRIYFCSKELNKGMVFGQPVRTDRASFIHSFHRSTLTNLAVVSSDEESGNFQSILQSLPNNLSAGLVLSAD